MTGPKRVQLVPGFRPVVADGVAGVETVYSTAMVIVSLAVAPFAAVTV